MDKVYLQFLYEYNYWARDVILEQAAALSQEQLLAERPYGLGSVRNVLMHCLGAEWLWRVRCQERRSPTILPTPADFPTLESLRARWREEEEAMRGYVGGLTAGQLEEVVRYRTTGGETQENVLWHLLVHVVNHGTEHRSQLAAMLTEFGHSPGNMDMVRFLRPGGG